MAVGLGGSIFSSIEKMAQLLNILMDIRVGISRVRNSPKKSS
jgi:hypothetical protein